MSWSYDAWGDRNQSGCATFSASYNSSNQIASVGSTTFYYDAAGNLSYDGTHHYYYDGENRLIQVDGTLGTCSSAGACYAYDAEGKRVEKVAGSSTIDYLYSLDGHVIVEPLSGGGTNAEYIYAGSQLVAEYANSTTRFVHEDHLGSTRLMTNLSGCIVESLDYLPFGELNSVGSASCTSADTTHKFTGKERDSESGLDNFGARYNSSQYGRFMTPDPLGGQIGDPQTLNKYAYVRNNPLNLIDPTDMMDETAGGITGDNSGNPDCSELGQSYCNNVNVDWGFGIGYNGICGGDTGSCTNLFGGGSAFDGIWDESLPSGVQVFGSGGFGRLGGSTCTYGSGSCGGGVYGWTDGGEVVEGLGGVCAIQPETCGAFVIAITVYGIYEAAHATGVDKAIADKIHAPMWAKGGKGNVADTGVMQQVYDMIAAGTASTVCDALQKLYDASSGTQRNKIKATQKAKGCRGH